MTPLTVGLPSSFFSVSEVGSISVLSDWIVTDETKSTTPLAQACCGARLRVQGKGVA